jgi:hypothetical protein
VGPYEPTKLGDGDTIDNELIPNYDLKYGAKDQSDEDGVPQSAPFPDFPVTDDGSNEES